MQIVDNLISLKYQQQIKNMFTSFNFPWFFNKSNIDIEYKNIMSENYNIFDTYSENPQFSHIFFLDGTIKSDEMKFNLLKPLIEIIEDKFDIKNSDKKKLQRIKANLLTPSRPTFENKCNIPHTDGFYETDTVLYYVNDSDGDTIIFEENLHTYKGTFNKDITISPKMGRVAFFDSSTYHTSSCPINSKYRIVLNIVYST